MKTKDIKSQRVGLLDTSISPLAAQVDKKLC